MDTLTELQQLLENGFSDEKSLINQRDVKELITSLEALGNTENNKNKGYTLPLLDTIGMNLYGKFSCQIKDT